MGRRKNECEWGESECESDELREKSCMDRGGEGRCVREVWKDGECRGRS